MTSIKLVFLGDQRHLLVEKLLRARREVTGGMILPTEHPLVREESLDTDGSTSMNPTRADTHFGAESKSIPVGESCRGIVECARTVDAREERVRLRFWT